MRVARESQISVSQVSHKCLKPKETVTLNCTGTLSVVSSIFLSEENMAISIEQFRSRIGSHDNFVKTKDVLAR